MTGIELAAPLRWSDVEAIGGFVAGAAEAIGLDKGFQVELREVTVPESDAASMSAIAASSS